MFWIKKRKQVKLTFHTHRQSLIKLFPPSIGMKNLPDWFHNNDKSASYPNINKCSGLNELYKKAINIPLWSDINFSYSSNGILDIRMPGVPPEMIYEYVTHHNEEQYNNAFKDSYHFKLMNPWLITSDSLVPFLMIDSTWNRSRFDQYTVLPGMVEFKYQTGAHINCFIHPTKHQQTLKLQGGNPICQLVPLEDVDIKIEYKKVSMEEWRDLLPNVWTDDNLYRKSKKMMEKNNV